MKGNTKRISIDEYIEMHATDKKRVRKNRDIEHQIQCSCVRWFALKYPKFRANLFAVPNGGRRDKVTAAKMKSEGVLAGVSDLILLKSNKFYGALLIEMKTPAGEQSKEQKKWQQAITQDGDYKYVVCRSLDDFITEVENYLSDY